MSYGIPKTDQCIGSGGAPSSRGTHTESDGSKTGRCPVCSGRFKLRQGILLPEHRAAAAEAREDPNAW